MLRHAFLYTLLALSVLTFAYTEVLSLFNALAPVTAWGFWLTVSIVCSLFAYQRRNTIWSRIKQRVASLPTDQPLIRFLWFGGIFLVIPLLILAVVAPPSNFDSHHYHLNRVLCWLQNGNVDHYPTMYVQQLYHNVMAEYLVMTTMLLTGSDRFANLVQFGGMLGSLVAVSLLAQTLGLSRRGQFVATVLLFSLPIGLFEATTTQVDYLACCYFLCFLAFGYTAIQEHNHTYLWACLIALALGGFTKYTILLFSFPFAVYFGWQILRQWGFRQAAQTLGGSMVLFVVTFGPFFGRNYGFFGHVLGPTFGSRIYNEKIPVDTFSVANTLGNTLKNMGLHLALPLPAYNRWVDQLIQSAHNAMGILLFDEATSYDHYHTHFTYQEDMASNTFHFLLILGAVAVLFVWRGNWRVKGLFAMGLAGFVLFSTLLKFQLWSSRTHMPFFAVGCVIIAYVYEVVFRQKKLFPAVFFYALAAVVVYGNPGKMLLPVRYLAKRITAHIPRDICPANAQQQAVFASVMAPYYDVRPGQSCYLLRQAYTDRQRRIIFGKLDSIDYFHVDKVATVWAESRPQAYFANHRADYPDFARALPYLRQGSSRIGVLLAQKDGFYHYWSALACQIGRPVEMAYVRYPREYKVLPNAQRAFRYGTILSDNLQLVETLVPPNLIASIHPAGRLVVVHLKQATAKVFVY